MQAFGIKHHPVRTPPTSSISTMFIAAPWWIRYRLPLSQPVTSKKPFALYWASCSGDSHSFKSSSPRASVALGPADWNFSHKPRSQRAADESCTNADESCTNMEAKLTAYEARNKQCLFRLWIKRPRHCYFPGSDPCRRGKASAGQLFETFFGPQDRLVSVWSKLCRVSPVWSITIWVAINRCRRPATPLCYVLNNSGFAATYSAQSSCIMRFTSYRQEHLISPFVVGTGNAKTWGDIQWLIAFWSRLRRCR